MAGIPKKVLELLIDGADVAKTTGKTAARTAKKSKPGATRAAKIADLPPTSGPSGAMTFENLPPPIGHNGAPMMGLDTIDLPAGSQPAYVGAAPDRSPASYGRYEPAKGTSERMQRLEQSAQDPSSPLNSMFDRYVEKGRELKGEDWYNTEELRDWFIEALGPEKGHTDWMDFMAKIGAGSTGSKVPENIRIASMYRALGEDAPRVAELVKAKGITPGAASRELGIEVPGMPDNYQYGHVKQGNHASNIINQSAGNWAHMIPEGLKGAALTKWLQANPKVKGFFNSLIGNKDNIAADMHFMRMLAMSDGGVDFLGKQAKLNMPEVERLRAKYGKAIEPYINSRSIKGKANATVEVNLNKAGKDGVITDTSEFKSTPSAWADTPDATEYAAYEQMAQRTAERFGQTPAQFQASLWMGAGDMTNLADASQGTFMDLFRRGLDKRGAERGLSRREMFNDFAINRAPLAVPGAMVGQGLLDSEPQPGSRPPGPPMRGLLGGM